MGNSNNMRLVHMYFDDVLRDGKHELLDEIIHPAYIPFQNSEDSKNPDQFLMNHELMKITGIKGIKSRFNLLSEQFGNINFQMIEVVETNETVVVHYKVSMRHIGIWNEIPATGTEISTFGFHLFQFKDNKIFSISGMFKLTDILSQIGAAITNEKADLSDYLENIRKMLKL